MTQRKITQTFLDRNLAKQKPGIVRDSDMSGFGVRISPQRRVTFIVEKKISGTRKAPRLTIGEYPAYDLVTAKDEAAKLIQLCSKGIDPRDHLKEAKKHRENKKAIEKALDVTFETLFEEFMSAKSDLKDSTQYDYRNTITLYCSDWMERPVREITEDDVLKKYKAVTKKAGRSKKESGKGQAAKLIRILRAIFNYALRKKVGAGTERQRLIRDNPCEIIKNAGIKVKTQKRDRVLSPSELKALIEELSQQQWLEEWGKTNVKEKQGYMAMRKLIREEQNKGYVANSVRHLIELILCSGLRKQEALSLKWQDVSFEDGMFTVRDTKNRKDHTIPMTKTLRRILEERREKAPDKTPWVFPALRQRGKHMNDPRKQLQIFQEEVGFEFRLHDLRRTFASYGHAFGLDDKAIGRALNHKLSDVTAGYIVPTVDTIRPIFENIEKQIRSYAFGAPIREKMTRAEEAALDKAEKEFEEQIEAAEKESHF